MAEQEDSAQEKTEEPTERRKSESKKKGQVPRSRDLTTMALMMVACATLLIVGPSIVIDLMALMRRGFTPEAHEIFDPEFGLMAFERTVFDALWLATPLMIVMLVIALVAPILLGGWVFSGESLQPKLSKLNPLKGLKRMFSLKGLVELLKALGKFLVVAVIAGFLLMTFQADFLSLGLTDLDQALARTGNILSWSVLVLSCGLILIAAVDVPFQIWQHTKQLRMSKQEIKDESKETQGKPEVKSRIRQLQMQMAQARMMNALPEADVVITNPTHYAVALKYDQDSMGAPRLLAKGKDLIALRIREVAIEHSIPIVEAPPLARAVYASTELEQEIPAQLYVAVAQVLAFVFQIRKDKRHAAKNQAPNPDVPVDFLREHGVEFE